MISKKTYKIKLKYLSLILLSLVIVSVCITINNISKAEITLKSNIKDISQENKTTVVIDMGHGGNDQGTQNIDNGILEKDITLEIGLKVTELLEENGNIEILTTRTEDEYVSLSDRIKFSNDNDADIFISLHCNADPSGTSSINGVETFYWKDDTTESYNLAQLIQSNISNNIEVRDRGVKQDNFEVIESTECPAVLVEMGFLTNNIEAINLSNDEYQYKMAQAIVNGIQEYLNAE